MLIEKLRLKNYRQYVDEEIIFSDEKNGKRITIIQGANGSGKTNIVNAITWCLYDKELHLGDKNRGLPILSTMPLNELEMGCACDIIVELSVIDADGNRMIFKRRATYRKSSEGRIEKLDTKFDIFYQQGNDMKKSEYPESLVSHYLPEDIHNYFFFDCERLDDYFKSESKHQSIKKEVFRISQLALFENVISHLRKRNNEYAKKLKDDNPAAEHTLELINLRKKRLGEATEELYELSTKEKEAAELETEMAEKLRSCPSSKEVNKLQERREKLHNQCQDIERDIEEAQDKQKRFLIKMAPLIICHEPLQHTFKMISEKIDKGEIPPDYKKSFLTKLLDSTMCICGTDLSKGSHTRTHVERLLKECEEITNITEELIVERHNLEIMYVELEAFRDAQVRNSKQIVNMQQAHDDINKELKIIGEKLLNINDEEIQRWEKRGQMARKQKEAAIERRGMLKHEMRDLEKEIEGLNKKYERELEKMEKGKELKRTLLFCNRTIKAAEEVKKEIMEEIRGEIEKRTRDQFFELIWKKGNFKEISIDEDYEISVTDQSGREAIGTLSAGERQVLALSFMAALNMVSGFDSPLIIDTPLGRISREPKLNIAEKLPTYLSGKQLTLLVTEEEYTPEVRKIISKNVGKEYKIRFREFQNGSKAEVMPYD